jgi:hypothetical protein
MMGAYSRWVYCLYLRLRDREDREITVSLSGKEVRGDWKSKLLKTYPVGISKCTLLRDVEPADFRCDPAAFNKFLAKLNPILGNLRNVHQAWLKNEDKVIDSPQTYFSLESWKVGGETGYTLLSCVPLEGS